MILTITTGDNTIEQVQLTINDVPLLSSPMAVSVTLVNTTRTAAYMETPEVQDPDADGASWGSGLITVKIPGGATAAITYQGKALLEVQATIAADHDISWWVPVVIKRGHIG